VEEPKPRYEMSMILVGCWMVNIDALLEKFARFGLNVKLLALGAS
jgi:hypothetical protein